MRGRQRSRVARRALLCGVATFVLLQLGLAVLIDKCLPMLRDPAYAIRLEVLKRRLRSVPIATGSANAPPKLVLMLGSSRTLNALCGGRVEAELQRQLGQPVVVFNLGITSAGPPVELLTLARLLRDGIRPDLLLIEVLPPFLGEAGRVWIPSEQLDWGDLTLVRQYELPLGHQLRKAWRRSWPIPCYTHRFRILGEVLPRLFGNYPLPWPHDCDASGWLRGKDQAVSRDLRNLATENARSEYAESLQSFRLDSASCQALRRVLQECEREHIPAALVLMPEGPIFQSWYPAPVRHEIDAFLEGLHQAHGTPLVNARDWVSEDDFFDSHHLMIPGAERFTERLAREVIAPMLEGSR